MDRFSGGLFPVCSGRGVNAPRRTTGAILRNKAEWKLLLLFDAGSILLINQSICPALTKLQTETKKPCLIAIVPKNSPLSVLTVR